MLLTKGHDSCGDAVCLVQGLPGSVEGSLQLRAAQVVSRAANRAVSVGGARSVAALAAYLAPVHRRPLTLVVTLMGMLRPRFLPLEYHWAPTERDAFLALVEALPPIDALVYVPHPLAHAQMEGVLCLQARLRSLSLREGADDGLLRLVGGLCRSLAFLDVGGSKGVTDGGLRRLLLRPPAASRFHWRQLYRRWRELRAASGAAYQPIFTPAPASPALEPAAQRTRAACTLHHLDLRGTKVSLVGAEWASKRLEKGAHVLIHAQTPPTALRTFRLLKSASSGEEGRQFLLADS